MELKSLGEIINLEFDVVIVLANEMDANGVLNEESIARVKKAVEVYKKCNVSYLVTCGWAYRSDSKIRIGDALKNYAVINCGIFPENVLVEGFSRDTVGDAFFTKKNLILPFSWKQICIVTSDYHVARTEKIFKFIFGGKYTVNVQGAKSTPSLHALENEKKSIVAFKKTFTGIKPGDDFAIHARMRSEHPYYNGQEYERI
jgi:uncharacterized SAM-binding protein YcdF (DUF218 family)